MADADADADNPPFFLRLALPSVYGVLLLFALAMLP